MAAGCSCYGLLGCSFYWDVSFECQLRTPIILYTCMFYPSSVPQDAVTYIAKLGKEGEKKFSSCQGELRCYQTGQSKRSILGV